MDSFGLVALIICLLLVYNCLIRKRRNRPPGPWNLPVVGYLPFLDHKAPYKTLTKLSERFGPVYGLYLGSIYTVVISDAKLVKRAFNQDSASGRAPLYLTHGIMKGYGLICAQGALWKDQRKFVFNTLRTLGATKIANNKRRIEVLIKEHVQELVEFIKSQGREPILDPLEPLRHTLGSIINVLVFGEAWSRDDQTWKWLQHLQEEGTKYIGVAGPSNFLPFLRFVPSTKQTINFLIEGKLKTHEIYKEIIEDRKIKFDVNNPITNFIDAFLLERNKRKDSPDLEAFYSDQQFYHLLADIFGASLDTTLTTLRWFLLYISVFKESQEKIRKELINDPSLDDLAHLPYLEAAIAEVQRIRSVVPVGIPHGTTVKMEIDGYEIPEGTMIVPLQWAIHMNPRAWTKPKEFRPERFLDEEGRFCRRDDFIPFQAGKRMCVGDELARMFLTRFGAIIIKNFELSCEDSKEIDLNGDCGITLTPKSHKLVFKTL